MANVLFKRGLQSNLDALRTSKTATDGTFYMTSDSHRLYVGIANGDAVPVNEGITIVNNLGQLPEVSTNEQKRQHTGQFYYVDGSDKDKNILCVFNGQKWVQINPNTNTAISNVKYDVTVTDNTASIKYTITEIDKVTGTGGASYDDTFTIKGANGLEVTSSGKDVTITGDTYELGVGYDSDTKEATISLTSENTDNDSSFKIKSKDGNLSMRKSANDTLELSVKDTILESVSAGNGANAEDTSTNKEGLYVTVKDSAGHEGTAQLNPIFQVGGEQAFYETAKIVNGTVTLPVYSKTEIDTKMKTLDAMRYRGTLGTGGSVTSLSTIVTQLELGDTFLIAGATYEYTNSKGTTYTGKKGDMFIINGTEIPNTGKIDPTTLTIDVVPSGDDAQTDTHYTVVPNATGFTIQGSTGQDAGIVTFAGDDNISVSAAADPAGSTTAKVTITHAHLDGTAKTANTAKGDTTAYNYTQSNDYVEQQQGSDLQIQVVESIIRDAAGHIKGVNVKKYKLTDTNGHMDQDGTKVVGTTNNAKTVATVTSTIGFATAKGQTTSANAVFAIASNSLQVNTTNSSDGKSTSVAVDMVWGSFDPA
jgi:hypothetical protein